MSASVRNKAASEFILWMTDLFDIIESRSNFGEYTKTPLDLKIQ